MSNDIKSVGVHIVILAADGNVLDKGMQDAFDNTLRSVAEEADVILHATSLMDDHCHILISADAEDNFLLFLHTSVQRTAELFGQTEDKTIWNENLHISLGTRNKVEILGSYVRDQEYIHSKYTVAEELFEIFYDPMDIEEAIAVANEANGDIPDSGTNLMIN